MMRSVVSLVIDLVLVGCATIAALLLRDNFEFSELRFAALLPYLAVTLAISAIVLPAFGATRMITRMSGMADYLRLCAAACIIVLTAMALGFTLNRMGNVSRSLPFIQGMLIMLALVGSRVLVRLRHSSPARPVMWSEPKAGPEETILLVGLTQLTDLYLRAVAEYAPGRIHIAGIVGRTSKDTNRSVRQYPILGAPDDIIEIRRNLEVHGIVLDRIVVTSRFNRLSPKAQQALLEIEMSTSIKVEYLAEQLGLDVNVNRPAANSPGEPPLAASDQDPSSAARFAISSKQLEELARQPYWRIKRGIDAVLSIALLVVLAPLMLLIAMLVVIDVGFPVTFWQRRPGLSGRPLRLYKFRTMAPAHDRNGNRVDDSERLSLIGRFLRRTRLDELPQLLNILFGEMSFIGPRPLLPADQPPEFSARLLVRPGLTGWAQVKGGRGVHPEDKAALDVWYVKNASFALDFRIVLETIRTIAWGETTDVASIKRAWRDLTRAGIWTGPNPWALGGVAGSTRGQEAA